MLGVLSQVGLRARPSRRQFCSCKTRERSTTRDRCTNIDAWTTLSMAGKEMTLAELRKYDGCGEGGRIYVAINGKVFDVTEKGRHFYGAGR